VQRYEGLRVWREGHDLVIAVYGVTGGFPKHEIYGITSQLRRAAVSVPTNIAEGSRRISRKEYSRFLNTAEASLAEVSYLLVLSRDLGYLPPDSMASLSLRVERILGMLVNLRKRVELNDWVEGPAPGSR
jgi:four helix bundle protein